MLVLKKIIDNSNKIVYNTVKKKEKFMEILEIAETIKQNGGNLYLVGGAVRDELIGKPVYDRDYCVTGISKETFIKLFPNAKILGKSFEVFEIEHNQFALARKEQKNGVRT